MTLVGALDIGGTKILAALVELANGQPQRLLAKRRLETRSERGAEDVIARAVAALHQLVQEQQEAGELTALGCSVPGPLDFQRGIVHFSPNLGWCDLPLAKMLSGRLGVPALIDDDARCAALGEALRGAARDAESAVYVTVSTGIGGGVVIGGRLYRGAHNCAGEIGHITLEASGPPCSCGNAGCLEALASGSAIAARGRAALRHGDETLLSELVEDPAALTAEHVLRASTRGDRVATRILEEAGDYLGSGLAAIAGAFDPEVIVVGGGVMQAGQSILLDRARETFRRRAIPPLGSLVRIVPAELGEESGLWGAAALIT
jgi:glucokinase